MQYSEEELSGELNPPRSPNVSTKPYLCMQRLIRYINDVVDNKLGEKLDRLVYSEYTNVNMVITIEDIRTALKFLSDNLNNVDMPDNAASLERLLFDLNISVSTEGNIIKYLTNSRETRE